MSEITDSWSHRRREAGATGKAADAAGRRRDDVGGRQCRRPRDEEGRQDEIDETGSSHSTIYSIFCVGLLASSSSKLGRESQGKVARTRT